ncbi:ABC transporter ATP-binding protein [Thermoanaerobacterium thermosaccharolyticum]|uniref:ABC transporter ATP-binding protein n=1 Tax=Thermoanaerobacterium thermosaccharolyticum TaxID=1517 RepID=UPI00177D703F|nr:ABC transporter ATP-binding protein [Thermoanaerobacterium thermosaccharolyticum]MBE0069261.1 ABC transporter ATP-binding protein [Thermoanaerobacterium thermosaccharolyticum]MBE0229047.1 ABC transporter ATP-binding protein [Thermoanaerobacterium thermosaccharolyticum]
MYAIEVKNVSKSFKIYHDKPTTLKEKLLFIKNRKYEIFKALENVSLNIKNGEAIGLIGENGSGKSTLLKLISKIIYPDEGEIITRGKVSSLLELGAGFHPDFTGRENIYVNASIFGFSKKEIENRINDIIDFSELEEFIDNPVRTYSSGMYMRLAFSIAINIDPDILLIDEILAVGDENFQKKCFNKIKEFKNKGITIVIVSHDLGSIQKICDKVIWIDNGNVKAIGEPKRTVDMYLETMAKKNEKIIEKENIEITNKLVKNEEIPNDNNDKKKADLYKSENNDESKKENENRWGNRLVEITDVKLYDNKNEETYVFKSGDECIIKIMYKCNAENLHKVDDICFGIGIFNSDSIACYGTNTFIDRVDKFKIKDNGYVICKVNKLNLVEGKYFLDVACHMENGTPYDYQKSRLTFSVFSEIKDVGVAKLEHTWEIN